MHLADKATLADASRARQEAVFDDASRSNSAAPSAQVFTKDAVIDTGSCGTLPLILDLQILLKQLRRRRTIFARHRIAKLPCGPQMQKLSIQFHRAEIRT